MRTLTSSITLGLLGLAWTGTSLAAAALQRHPYPQNVGRTSATVMWRTATPAAQTVQYGTDGSYSLSATEAVATTAHEVVLQGLQPGKVYSYRIVEGVEVVVGGEGYTFRTDAGRSDTELSFFVTGDVGEDQPEEARQHLTQDMIRRVTPRAEFGLLCGDNVYPDGESTMYDSVLMKPWQPLLSNTPVYPCLGNHDWHVDPDQNFVKEWALPNNEHYYSFDYGNAHFIALDTADAFIFDEANQLAWLEADLASPAARSATWRFVYYHHPVLTCTYKSNQPEIAAKFWPIFKTGKVDAVFNGHAHTFERLFPLDNGVPVNMDQNPNYVDPQGTMYVLSGCGGKFKVDEPTTFCGPTAAFIDQHILFSQVFIYDHMLFIVTFDSTTGAIVDYCSITKTPTTSDVALAPLAPRLRQNVPNPFNPSTTIPFELPAPAHVRMRVFRADGTWVANLVDRSYPVGAHRIVWDGRDGRGMRVPSGAYIVRLQSDASAEAIKMMLVR